MPDTQVQKETGTSENSQVTGSSADGNVGDASVATGGATNNASILTDANKNLTTSSVGIGGISVKNTENGADSNNSSTVNSDTLTQTGQQNSASVVNNLNQTTTTGNNSASKNTGGDSTITTGDANTTGNIITSVNTNVAGVSVYEFNVADDHNGDIILAFTPESTVSAVNQANGAGSTNNATVNSDDSDSTFQANDADVLNNMVLEANTGNNHADRNTGGDSTITTGDANVSANIVTLANNNIAGKLVYAVVNIFGDLIGNIILPQEALSALTAANTGNGSDSTNTSTVNLADTELVNQFNSVDIQNNLVFDANTGGNDVSRNTGGNSNVATGDANIKAQVINIANLNIISGDAWLVIVNEAGNWIGKIIGTNGNVFGSVLLEFAMGADGSINVTNEDNGADSSNSVTVNQNSHQNITQINNANIVNNVQLSANTGGNSSSRNTNGDSTITTGDANIIANLINFANNNITASGNLFVTVVNIFGSWVGDFFGPGMNAPLADHQDTKEGSNNTGKESARGGQSTTPAQSTTSQSTNSNNSGLDTPVNQTTVSLPQTLASHVVSNVKQMVGQILDEGITDVQAEELSPETLAKKGDKKDVNINLAWGIPLGALLLSGEYLRRRFMGQ